jgi:hypothetical protein
VWRGGHEAREHDQHGRDRRADQEDRHDAGRSEVDGPSSWWWTPEAEAALDVNALRRTNQADLN